MDDASPVFANLIADARRARGMSQEDLEAASGVSRGTLSRWETGRTENPEPAHVRAVCKSLGIDPRRAAIALGYLTEAEVEAPRRRVDPEVEEALAILEDPQLPPAARAEWIEFLRFRYQQANRKIS